MEPAFDAQGPPPAGFWIRFVAVLIDSLVLFVVEFVLGVVAGLVWGGEIAETKVFKVTVTAFMFVFGSVYYVALHTAFGQTLGKMAMKIRVVLVDGGRISVGTAILRYIGYFVSGLIFGIGYLMAGLRHDKRALHDLLAGTRVVRLVEAR